MTKRSATLQIEELETRAVPTVAAVLPAAGAIPDLLLGAQVKLQHGAAPLGTVQGTYTTSNIPADTGTTFTLQGTGHLDFLGHVNLSGSVHTTGNVASGHAGGDITLSNVRGSITIHLRGPLQPGFGTLPSLFHFSIVSATGAFKGLQMSGIADLTHNAAGHSFSLTFEHPAQIQDPRALAGHANGSFHVGQPIPDVGTLYHLTGSGNFGLLGHATLSGSVQSVGSIQTGRATGTLTLTNAQGSVTLRLAGPKQSSFAALPTQFHFSVVAATGAYKGLKVTGTIQLKLDDIVWLHPPGGTGPTETGHFHLTIDPNEI